MARKSDQIASLFASVGFKIDKKSVNDLDASLRKVEGQLSRISKAFRGLKGNTSISKSLQNTRRDAGKAATEINNLSDSFRKGIGPLQAYTQQVNATASALRALAGAAGAARLPRTPQGGGGGGGGTVPAGGRPNAGTGFLAGLMGSPSSIVRQVLPGIGAGWLGVQGVRKARELQGVQMAYNMLLGDTAGKQEYGNILNMSREMGMSFAPTAMQYKGLLAASVNAQGLGATTEERVGKARNIFRGVSAYGLGLGVNEEQMQGALTAITQMMDKGKIYSEELRQQLAERMPGAVQILAASLNVPLEKMYKMLETGEVMSATALPEMAKRMEDIAVKSGALAKYQESSLAAQRRFNIELVIFLDKISRAGFDKLLARVFTLLTDILKLLGDILPYVINIGLAFATWYAAITLMKFTALAKDIWAVVKAVWALNVALGATTGSTIAAGFTKFLAMMKMIGRVVFLTWAPVLVILDTIWGMFSDDLSLIEYGVKKLGLSDKLVSGVESVVKGLGFYPGQEGTPEGALKYESGGFYPNPNKYPINPKALEPYTPINIPSLDQLLPASPTTNQQSVIINVNGGDLTSVRKVVEDSVSGMMNRAKTTYNNRTA